MAMAFLGYFTFIALSYLIVRRRYRKANVLLKCYGQAVKISAYRCEKMPIWCIVTIAVLFSLYNFVITTEAGTYGGDRTNYLANFMGDRPSISPALNIVISFSRLLGLDFNLFLCLISFISTASTLMAYRLSVKTDPYTFYLLCLTQHFFFSLTALKQTFAVSLAILFFVIITEYRTKRSRILCLVLAVIASLFHTTGFILFPLFIVLSVNTKRKGILIYFGLLVLFVLFFDQIVNLLQAVVSPVIPSLGNKLQEYFGNSGGSNDGAIAQIIKGLPYYFIVIFGLIYRKRFVKLIDNYDKYLIIAGTGAALYTASYHSYWFVRFIYLFSFSAIILWREISKNLSNYRDRIIFNIFVQAGFAIVTFRFLYLIYALSGGF